MTHSRVGKTNHRPPGTHLCGQCSEWGAWKGRLGGVDVRNQIHPYIQRNKCHASLFKQVRMTFSLKDSQPPPFEDSHAGSITCKINWFLFYSMPVDKWLSISFPLRHTETFSNTPYMNHLYRIESTTKILLEQDAQTPDNIHVRWNE